MLFEIHVCVCVFHLLRSPCFVSLQYSDGGMPSTIKHYLRSLGKLYSSSGET